MRISDWSSDVCSSDLISPAGNIKKDSPAGRFLQSRGVDQAHFNSYGSRRGNDDVMVRGTFANIRIKNLMLGGEEGGNTLFHGGGANAGSKMSILIGRAWWRESGWPYV